MTFDPRSYQYSQPAEPSIIRSRTVLPAWRENFEVTTADNKTLVGEIALPEAAEPQASLLTFHPLPTQGGYMDSHLYKKASFRLPALADIAVIRFNTRGTSSQRGRSEGVFDGGFAEEQDVDAMITWAAEHQFPNRWLVGWSFGTELILKYAAQEKYRDLFTGVILLSPPLKRVHPVELDAWNLVNKPIYALVPEYDEFCPPASAIYRFSAVPRVQVIPCAGAKHLWVGEKYVTAALNKIVTILTGKETELPSYWEGPVAEEIQETAWRDGLISPLQDPQAR
ncbi:MAG: alpha/beta hydrolase [Rothia sp. (in: high G+C Gram-positive bacteria)]|nr:alpha/beta hydrolase [Rothia sp. (in: high G+C Gram-positive bacteria)]